MIDSIGELLRWIVIIGVSIFGIVTCNRSDWHQEMQRADAEKARLEAMPRVIREADGCKVYAFKSGGSTHYFTRCGETVTTERAYSQACGKGCVRSAREEIITNSNK